MMRTFLRQLSLLIVGLGMLGGHGWGVVTGVRMTDILEGYQNPGTATFSAPPHSNLLWAQDGTSQRHFFHSFSFVDAQGQDTERTQAFYLKLNTGNRRYAFLANEDGHPFASADYKPLDEFDPRQSLGEFPRQGFYNTGNTKSFGGVGPKFAYHFGKYSCLQMDGPVHKSGVVYGANARVLPLDGGSHPSLHAGTTYQDFQTPDRAFCLLPGPLPRIVSTQDEIHENVGVFGGGGGFTTNYGLLNTNASFGLPGPVSRVVDSQGNEINTQTTDCYSRSGWQGYIHLHDQWTRENSSLTDSLPWGDEGKSEDRRV